MPIALVRSFSPPNLKIYTTVSVLLVSLCFYYAFETVRHPDWMQNRYNTSQLASRSIFLKSSDVMSIFSRNDFVSSLSAPSVDVSDNSDIIYETEESENNRNVSSRTVMKHLRDVLIFMSHEPICIWVSWSLVNILSRSSDVFAAESMEQCNLLLRVQSTCSALYVIIGRLWLHTAENCAHLILTIILLYGNHTLCAMFSWFFVRFVLYILSKQNVWESKMLRSGCLFDIHMQIVYINCLPRDLL